MSANTFGDWLELRLRRREWNQSDLARAMGIRPSVVNRWVKGERLPSPSSARKLAMALGEDEDVVLVVAGHRSTDVNLDPDDPRMRIMELVERLDPSRPEVAFYLESLEYALREMLKPKPFRE